MFHSQQNILFITIFACYAVYKNRLLSLSKSSQITFEFLYKIQLILETLVHETILNMNTLKGLHFQSLSNSIDWNTWLLTYLRGSICFYFIKIRLLFSKFFYQHAIWVSPIDMRFYSIRNKINVLGIYIYIHHSDQMINLSVYECVLLLLRLLFFFFCFCSLSLFSHIFVF